MALFKKQKRSIQRLLIVEDEPLVAFDNEHVLTTSGYEVVATVDTGEAAMRYLSADTIDAVILDLNLAGNASGIDVARAAGAAGISVLFVTGGTADGAAGDAVALLAKPYRPADLVSALAAVDAVVQGRAVTTSVPGLQMFR